MAMNFEVARARMVEAQLCARGIKDPRVLAAMRTVPRHLFVDESRRRQAYEDSPLPIGSSQTISQPYMVALMSEVLELGGSERVLEIGTGSGYQAAVLAELASAVFSIERLAELADSARQRLAALGYGERVRVRAGDGGDGWAAEAPFDAIIVTAAVQSVPRPLLEQLAENGALVLPLGDSELQGLARIIRESSGLRTDYFGECRFVRWIGEYGWEE
jgi:protein-L-isoaspartate(D-aspartate) O-methyltransferase